MTLQPQSSSKITSYSSEVDVVDLLTWVKNRPEAGKFYLKLRDESWEWAGAGNLFESRNFSMSDAYSFINSEDHPGLKMFVAHTFNLDAEKSYFALPRFEINKIKDKVILKINCWKDEDPEKFLSPSFLTAELLTPSEAAPRNNSRIERSDVPNRNEWGPYFGTAQDFLQTHPKIVLARMTQSKWERPIDPFALLVSLNQESYRCYLRLPTGQEIVSVSPERLFRISDNHLMTEAVAGTRPRGSDIEEFLNCPKERAEHQYVVDEILRQIGPFCEKINYDETPKIASFKKVLHLKTPMMAKLKNNVSYLNLIEALHPTPAVGGLPKIQSVSWLQDNEPFKREFYAAPVGVVGKDMAELFVNIRSVLIDGCEMKLYSGVGVVRESKAQSEWDEMDLKASQFWEALPV